MARLVVRQGDILLVDLDPTRGAEMSKRRPCVVVSPDELNRRVRTVVVAPLTGSVTGIPFRVPTSENGKPGELALDHLRSVAYERVVRRQGRVDPSTLVFVLTELRRMFS